VTVSTISFGGKNDSQNPKPGEDAKGWGAGSASKDGCADQPVQAPYTTRKSKSPVRMISRGVFASQDPPVLPRTSKKDGRASNGASTTLCGRKGERNRASAMVFFKKRKILRSTGGAPREDFERTVSARCRGGIGMDPPDPDGRRHPELGEVRGVLFPLHWS